MIVAYRSDKFPENDDMAKNSTIHLHEVESGIEIFAMTQYGEIDRWCMEEPIKFSL